MRLSFASSVSAPRVPPAHRPLALAIRALSAAALLSACSTAPTAPPQAATPPAPAAAAPTAADAPLTADARFAQWLAGFREGARAAGIDEATLRTALDPVRLRPQAVASDRAQPEFTRTLWEYQDSAISPQRVANGQQRRAELAEVLTSVQSQYGVPGELLTAVWGIESNYGRNYGDVPVFDALATLGFEGRREEWARTELMAALKILQAGDIDRPRMVGSWAGAMGQTQFMPSSYLKFAVDADGDGRRDIWGSMPDVLASTANFLARSGWQAGEPWGLEVRLPAGFDPARADASVIQSSERWAEEGVRRIDSEQPLPAIEQAQVLMPAGVRGPAFLVGRNFQTLFRYNNSMSYALTVCLLAQRIGGGAPVQAPWPRDLRALTRSEILALQTSLAQRGFDSGRPDGQLGPATRNALRGYQRSMGLPADGFATVELLQGLQQTP